MTALTKYQRLETVGLWRAEAGQQRKNVIVSIGDATLVIAEPSGPALAHWSLPAVHRANPGEEPALFTPGADSTETLELSDPDMIGAIETVRRAIERHGPHRGRLRALLIASVLGAVGALSWFWLPGALSSYTASVVPEAKRTEIDRALLAHIERLSGPPCAAPYSLAALAKLDRRLGGSGEEVQVLPAGVTTAAHLPGGTVLLNRALLEDYEGPEAAAGYVLAERARASVHDPLQELLTRAGMATSVRLLTTGIVPDDTLRRYAVHLAAAPATPIDDEVLLDRFRQAGVSSTAYAYALDLSGETTLTLIEADPLGPAQRAPLLADDDWVSLQGICGG